MDLRIDENMQLARQGKDQDLDVLVNDKSWFVRREVAKQGRDKDLDILVNDEDVDVRSAVAAQGRNQDLDILVNDEKYYVRGVVAELGRDQDLDVLVNDKDISVLYALMIHRRAKDIEKLKTRIENGEFNNIPSEDEEMILDEIKNTIKEFKNKEKEKDDDFER